MTFFPPEPEEGGGGITKLLGRETCSRGIWEVGGGEVKTGSATRRDFLGTAGWQQDVASEVQEGQGLPEATPVQQPSAEEQVQNEAFLSVP